MIELPEARVLSDQFSRLTAGKIVEKVIANQNPHKLAWFSGCPDEYNTLLQGHSVRGAKARGGMVEVDLNDAYMVFSEGVNLRFHAPEAKLPKRHQLLLQFNDGSALTAAVQMYGGISCFGTEGYDNKYYLAARSKPSPYDKEFTEEYFLSLLSGHGKSSISMKALLATEQRVPGFGNGVLQDVLYTAGIHPKRKADSLNDEDIEQLFSAVKSLLKEMYDQGGRDTEKDLTGAFGGYKTRMSRNTVGTPCPRCSEPIVKQNYMGGSVYVCPGCQGI